MLRYWSGKTCIEEYENSEMSLDKPIIIKTLYSVYPVSTEEMNRSNRDVYIEFAKDFDFKPYKRAASSALLEGLKYYKNMGYVNVLLQDWATYCLKTVHLTRSEINQGLVNYYQNLGFKRYKETYMVANIDIVIFHLSRFTKF